MFDRNRLQFRLLWMKMIFYVNIFTMWIIFQILIQCICTDDSTDKIDTHIIKRSTDDCFEDSDFWDNFLDGFKEIILTPQSPQHTALVTALSTPLHTRVARQSK